MKTEILGHFHFKTKCCSFQACNKLVEENLIMYIMIFYHYIPHITILYHYVPHITIFYHYVHHVMALYPLCTSHNDKYYDRLNYSNCYKYCLHSYHRKNRITIYGYEIQIYIIVIIYIIIHKNSTYIRVNNIKEN